MKLAIISFTERGSKLNEALGQALSMKGYDCVCFGISKYASKYHLTELEIPLKEWTGKMFQKMDGILFISATGIAVRSIAPYVQDKTKDPAIVVMDEKGVFAISLMSGHLGGANELTAAVANLTGAIPVITTATDVNGRFAVDVFAKKNGLQIESMKLAKAVSADILDEKKVGICSDFPIIGKVPEELTVIKEDTDFEGDCGICISVDKKKHPFKETLYLIPRIITLGLGCKRDTKEELIEDRVVEVLEKNQIPMKAIRKVCSIDLKAKEPGILAFCEKYGLEFETYPAEELQKVPGDFTESEFVRSVTGVSNVCERSAVLGSKKGTLIQKKFSRDGVTVALAAEAYEIEMN
ncbi:MAG: cobalt-precorrin 5A hydrolase [Muricoprocola sp.]